MTRDTSGVSKAKRNAKLNFVDWLKRTTEIVDADILIVRLSEYMNTSANC
jgi:hypothetical protein